MTKRITADVILDRAADLIEPAGRWTQRAAARGADGQKEEYGADEAVCWCLAGAVGKVKSRDKGWGVPVESYVLRAIGEKSAAMWNDAPERTQAEVVAKLREAAELARLDAAQ